MRRAVAGLLLCALLPVGGLAWSQAAAEKCREFLEYGLPSDRGALLCRSGFALAHDEEKKAPAWVVQRMTPERLINRVKRNDRFVPDPDLPKGARAELEDYRGSGYDRGHMAPAADMRWSAQAMAESFYLSNMAPQVGPGMNRGIWSEIEATIRQWVARRGELFIYTGPIFQTNAPDKIGPNQVAVPTHFYKIVFDPVRVETIAFVVPNAPHPNRRIEEFITSVKDIEMRTGLNFLNRISPAVQALIEEAVAPALW
ncbi:MAG: DNA/RNA non-specific endonuclease [Burkholderiaceae bacterium]|nr:DNA/RNA non-specific endonuclease [Burkholderiaceae bacterium]